MNELALFAGAGGGLLASRLLGHRVVCAVERNEFCIEVLCQRQNDGIIDKFPTWDDVRTFDGKPWEGIVDIVSGGFPCQSFSTAARGRRVHEKNMWPEMRRVIREVNPIFVFAENVSKKAIEIAARELKEDGYITDWISLSAKDLGADHIRRRYWLLAYSYINRKPDMRRHAEMAICKELRCDVWADPVPVAIRASDGVAYRMDRFEAIGNGQVPAVAVAAWIKLTEKMFGLRR
jgi:DNA (cytosine-5)-methyltransferase 1